ncbi:hypothetical protein CAOG_05461 [Capsaspora owczarzaki ATCC 30864]|uniref:Uncharacterized protein n=1 Tax=Capsaspora owczarzaki (strain ATCC 30864) TaxID=595528 RepID=A0A0D2WS55_CAPO3|nr:hypothetical protein CAOG_05461 [Capsaspora owczarzaki ATCC 30864]KJE94920.1 hypothetical protein CAOG_005461 [Capsaspora owczarzaki ATCC 30864]|eukprot:XP_004346134.2 hypothetical protein CAOG_05461 [Capsaspora owczarzaki ATCC 30864]
MSQSSDSQASHLSTSPARRPRSPSAAARSPSEVQRPRVEQPHGADSERATLEVAMARLSSALKENLRYFDSLATTVRDSGNIAQDQRLHAMTPARQDPNLRDAVAALQAENQRLQAESQRLLAESQAETRRLQAESQRLQAENSRFKRLQAQALGEHPLGDNDLLVTFWRALLAGQVTEQPHRVNGVDFVFLVLPDDVVWMGKRRMGRTLMVRECYPALFDIITNSGAERQPWVVIGNPGIGKTFFSAYFLYRIVQRWRDDPQSELTVVYEPAQLEAKPRYLLCSDQTVSKGSILSDHFALALDSLKTWYLVDGHAAGLYDAQTLLVTYPRREFYKELEKDSMPRRYMPVWSKDEIFACLHQQNATPENMRDAEMRFSRWGGIARQVFKAETLQNSERPLQEAINSCKIENIRSAVDKPAGEQEASHRIVHIDVLPSTTCPYQETRLLFASDWVVEQYLHRSFTEEHANLVHFLGAVNDLAPYASLRGQLLEKYAHSIIPQGGSFQIRDLSNTQAAVSTLVIPPLTRVLFQALNQVDLQSSNMYFQPTASNHPAIDAVISPNKFLQMTVSLNHPIKAQRLAEAVRLVPAPELYFVVPYQIFNDFKAQDYHSVAGQKLLDTPQNVRYVRQFALSLSLSTIPRPAPSNT